MCCIGIPRSTKGRMAFLKLLLFSALFSSTTAIECNSPTLSINEYRDVMESEMEEEFLALVDKTGMTEEQVIATATPVWDNANQYEFGRAKAEEETTGKPFPYIVCHYGPGLSSNKRKKELKKAVRDSVANVTSFTEEEADEYVESLQYATIAMNSDLFCGVTRMEFSIACGITDDSNNNYIRVQPKIMSLKMAAGTIGTILNRFADTEDEFSVDPSADFSLCPGASVDAKLAEKDIVAQSDSTDITAEFVAFLMDRGENHTCGDPNGQSAASQSLYWTDPSSPTLQEQIAITERTKYWGELFKRSIDTCVCDEMYKTRLEITVTRGDNSIPNDPDILNILFHAAGTDQSDTDCVIALVAAGALIPETCGVEVKGVVKTGNAIAHWLTQSNIENYVPVFDSGLSGAGQVVAISDTGLDVDNCYFYDADADEPSATRNDNHRKVVQYVDYVDDSDYTNGHGTHVSGTVAGRRAEDGKTVSDGIADGMAYNAKLAFLDIGDSQGNLDLPARDSDLLSTGRGTNNYNKDAHIHSASWGGVSNSYTLQARNFDNFMYKNDDFLILVAAGNSGRDGANTVGTPATAKNIISAGAHNSIKSASGGKGQTYVSDFSSRGPTSDGRMKPDMLAPGKFLVSAGADPFSTGECDDGSGERLGPGQSSPGLMSMAGTSMATPALAGTAALVRQYLQEGWHVNGTKGSGQGIQPSGALVKAILMNGAQWMDGADDGFLGKSVAKYDSNQGFGRASLIDSIFIAGKTKIQMSFFEHSIIDGGTNTYNVTIDKSGGCDYSELRATLAWTEPGSQSGCKFCLINDLDLLLTKSDGETFSPNGLPKGVTDQKNNVERVVIENVADKDSFTVSVKGTNLDSEQQKYALVLTGCFGGASVSASDLAGLGDSNGSNGGSNNDDNTKYIIIGVGAGVGAILLCIICVCISKRK